MDFKKRRKGVIVMSRFKIGFVAALIGGFFLVGLAAQADIVVPPPPPPTECPAGTLGTPPNCEPIVKGKVNMCHVPPGNPGNAHTINVSVKAVNAHLNHGDSLGACAG